MSRSAKFQRKVEAIRAIEKEDYGAACQLAKKTKMLKLKKTLILRTPGNQLFGALIFVNENCIRLALADNVKVESNSTGTLLDFTIEKPPQPDAAFDKMRRDIDKERTNGESTSSPGVSGARPEVPPAGCGEGQGDSERGVGDHPAH